MKWKFVYLQLDCERVTFFSRQIQQFSCSFHSIHAKCGTRAEAGAQLAAFFQCWGKLSGKCFCVKATEGPINCSNCFIYADQQPTPISKQTHVATIYVKHGYVVKCRITSVCVSRYFNFNVSVDTDTVVTIIIRCLSRCFIWFRWKSVEKIPMSVLCQIQALPAVSSLSRKCSFKLNEF